MGRALRARARSATSTLFVDVTFPPPRLIVFGAVDFAARAVPARARRPGWRPFVVDPRGRFAQPARFPDAEEVVAAWPEEAFARLGGIDRATAIAVLTHDPKLDDAALVLALRSDAGYIGAMGSRRAQAQAPRAAARHGRRRRPTWRASPRRSGSTSAALTAEETALSIMAEVVAVRHGRDGGRLAHAGGRDPRGARMSDRRARARRRGGARASAAPSSSRCSTGGRCSSTRVAAMLAVPALDRVVVVLGARAEEVRRGGRPARRRGRRLRRTGRRAVGASLRCGVAALGERGRGGGRARRPAGASRPRRSRGGARAPRTARAVRATYDGRPGPSGRCSARRCSTRVGELRGDAGFRELLSARPLPSKCGHLGDPADVDTREDLEVAAMKLEQSFEVAAPVDGSGRR